VNRGGPGEKVIIWALDTMGWIGGLLLPGLVGFGWAGWTGLDGRTDGQDGQDYGSSWMD
jgi:hypothetical protein